MAGFDDHTDTVSSGPMTVAVPGYGMSASSTQHADQTHGSHRSHPDRVARRQFANTDRHHLAGAFCVQSHAGKYANGRIRSSGSPVLGALTAACPRSWAAMIDRIGMQAETSGNESDRVLRARCACRRG